MTGLEVFAKALVGPLVGTAAKHAKTWLTGDAGLNELIKVSEQALDAALDLALAPYPDRVDRDYRAHLRSVLEMAISLIAAPETLFPITSDPAARQERLRRIVDEARASRDLDWSTFQISVDGVAIRLDETQILLGFLTDLPTRISARACLHGSPLHEFSTESHMVETLRLLLQLQSDVSLVLTRTSNTPDWEDAAPRAVQLQRGYLDRRRFVEDHRVPYVEPSAIEAWEVVKGRRDWPAEILSEARRLRTEMANYVKDAARLVPLEGFDGAATAAAAHFALRALRLDPVEAELLEESRRRRKKRTAQRDAPEEDDPADDRALGRTLARVRYLKAQAKNPTFEAAMGLVGGYGSGRSALLTHIGEQLSADGKYFVLLDLRDAASVELALLGQAARLFGGTFAAIEDLERFLSTDGDRVLHVLLDDFDVAGDLRPQLVPELAGLIDHATATRRLVFAVAFDESNTDKVLLANDPYFWTRYGYLPGRPHDQPGKDQPGTGWWDLGRRNLEEHLGLRIIAAANPAELPDVEQMTVDSETFATETTALANPLAAWLRIGTHEQTEPETTPATDVNQTEFVAAYWRRLKTLRPATSRATETIDASVTDLARALGEPMVKKLAVDDLVLPKAHGGIGLTQDDLSLLISAGLLVRQAGDVEVGQSATLEPRFAPLWGFRIARPLLFDADVEDGWPTFEKKLRGWQDRARAGESLGEAVCQFTLALLESNGHRSSASVWRDWAGGNRTPKAPLLLAVVGASPGTQQVVIDQIEAKRYRPRSKREMFLLLRFVARCQLMDWPGDERLVLLKPSYGRVAEHGLPNYLTVVLSRVLTTPGLVGEENYVRTLEALVGVGAADAADVAADLAVRCGRRIFGNELETWLVFLLRLCRRVAPAPRSPKDERSQTRWERQPKSRQHATTRPKSEPETDAFLAALLKRTAEEIASTDPAESYRVAATVGWCSAWDRGVADATARNHAQRTERGNRCSLPPAGWGHGVRRELYRTRRRPDRRPNLWDRSRRSA